MKTKLFVACIVWVILVHSAPAQITLDSLLAQVLRKNPGLHAARLHVGQADARTTQATAWEDPMIGVDFYEMPISTFNFIQKNNEVDYFIRQTIPFSGKKSAAGNAAEADAKMVESNAVALERRLIADVKKNYAMLYSAQRRLEVNEEEQDLLKQIISSAQAKYKFGTASQAEVLKAQVEFAKLENEHAIIAHEVHQPEAMLNTLRAAMQTDSIGRVADIPLTNFSVDLEELVAQALENNPMLRAMDYEVKKNTAELSQAGKERIPDLSVQGAFKDMHTVDFWELMLSINVPFAPWSVGKYSGKIEESQYGVKAAEEERRNARNMVEYQVHDEWVKARAHWEEATRYKTTIIPQSEQAFRSLLISYQTNRADFFSLLDGYRMVQMAKMQYYMSLADYLMHLAELEEVVGVELPH